MYLVTGATGDLGRRIVRVLRQGDRPVRAFARLTARYGDLQQREAEIFLGDLCCDRDLTKACIGVKYLILAHGSRGSDPNPNAVQDVDYRASIELIDAAHAAGVEHIVYISVLGADRGYEDAPVFKAKWAVEQHLRDRGVPYTILRPCGFASNLLPLAERFRDTGLYFTLGDLKNRASILSTDDLAAIAAAAPTTPAARDRTLAVSGPDVLQRGDIPRIFSRVFGRDPIEIVPPLAALDWVRGAIGLVNPAAKTNLGTLRTLLANEFYGTPEEVAEIESMFDLQLETLESFVRRYLSVPPSPST